MNNQSLHLSKIHPLRRLQTIGGKSCFSAYDKQGHGAYVRCERCKSREQAVQRQCQRCEDKYKLAQGGDPCGKKWWHADEWNERDQCEEYLRSVSEQHERPAWWDDEDQDPTDLTACPPQEKLKCEEHYRTKADQCVTTAQLPAADKALSRRRIHLPKKDAYDHYEPHSLCILL